MIDPTANPPDFDMVREAHRELLQECGRDYSRWFTQVAYWYLRPLHWHIARVTTECSTTDQLAHEHARSLVSYARAVHETYNAVLQHDQKVNPLEV
jgi:hypothetical protein